MDTNPPKPQSPPTGNPADLTNLQLTIMKDIKKYMYTNYKNPPSNSDQYSEIPESLTKKRRTPKLWIVTTRKSRPDYGVQGEGESSTPEPQVPTDGSYIIDAESCNI